MTTTIKQLKPERVFRALADDTRLRILNLLLQGEVCVCDLVAALRSPQPTISRHLMYLRKVGLVTARKDGVWNYYQLAPILSEFEMAVMQVLQACSNNSRMKKDRTLLQKARNACCQ
jgi:ArsR family transcriptional regulator